MPQPLPSPNEIAAVLDEVHAHAQRYFNELSDAPAHGGDADAAARRLGERYGADLPVNGEGALAALRELIELGQEATVHSGGRHFYHYVTGGCTPAALGGDLWATVIDQNAHTWENSPLAVQLELTALDWLKSLFGLPQAMAGILTTGATMANFHCLAAARQWWGQRHGADVAADGLHGLPALPVFTSGLVHASSAKALGMLGVGRNCVTCFSQDDAGAVDMHSLERALKALCGKPAVLIANAGEVNAGRFDPLEAFADLAQRYGAWLHVDGAFGLFAAASPRTRHLVAGVERAHSVVSDGHKWLNVPYDCGFAFVREHCWLAQTFAYQAHYLPAPDDPRPNLSAIGAEGSRRARSLAVWATLRAYGREGVRHVVENSLDVAAVLKKQVQAAHDLELLAEVPLCIVCFRFNPGGLDQAALDRLNRALGRALVQEGHVVAGTTVHNGQVGLRPALVNWRIDSGAIDHFIKVVRSTGATLMKSPSRTTPQTASD